MPSSPMPKRRSYGKVEKKTPVVGMLESSANTVKKAAGAYVKASGKVASAPIKTAGKVASAPIKTAGKVASAPVKAAKKLGSYARNYKAW